MSDLHATRSDPETGSGHPSAPLAAVVVMATVADAPAAGVIDALLTENGTHEPA